MINKEEERIQINTDDLEKNATDCFHDIHPDIDIAPLAANNKLIIPYTTYSKT